FLLLFFSALLNKKLDDFLFFIFLLYVFYFIIHNVFYFSGIISNEIIQTDIRERSSFGFTNVNRLSIFYFYLFLLSFYFLVEWKKIRLIVIYSLLCFISLFYIYLSQSRTALFCCALAVILFLLFRFNLFYKITRFSLN